MSAEFNFKSGWNNKAPPPALLKFFRNSHNAQDTVIQDKDDVVKTGSGNNLEHQINFDKNSNSNYAKEGHINTNELQNDATINPFNTNFVNFKSNADETFVYQEDPFKINQESQPITFNNDKPAQAFRFNTEHNNLGNPVSTFRFNNLKSLRC